MKEFCDIDVDNVNISIRLMEREGVCSIVFDYDVLDFVKKIGII